MKKHIYFREDLQELKELPITEFNCYYLGEFTDRQIGLIQKFLEKNIISFNCLEYKVNLGKFK